MKQFTYSQHCIEMTLLELADVCKFNENRKNTDAYPVQCACTVVANLIAGSGRFGGTEQTEMMRLAERAGFVPEFYADSIRVTWPESKPARKVAKG